MVFDLHREIIHIRNKAYNAVYRETHRKERNANSATYRQRHKERLSAYYWAHRDHILARLREYCHAHKEKVNANTKRARKKVKLDVFSHYSNGELKCAHCGEADLIVLCLDHIEGGGNKHRRTINRQGDGFYYWLRKNDYPDGFQVLCYHCNIRKQREQEEHGIGE